MKAFHQTPSRNEHNSRSSSDRKSKESQLKKPLKNAKKNWNGATAPDVSPEIRKESTEFSPVSEISEANQSTQTPPIPFLALNPAVSAPADTSPVSDVTPTSNISIVTDESAKDCCGLNNQPSSKIGQVEADIVVNLLKEARNEILKADFQSKNILDALIKVVIDDFSTPTEEKDLTISLISMKWRVVCLCFLIWGFAVSMFLLFGLGSGSSAGGQNPT